MFSFLSQPEYMPCEACGASLARPKRDDHVCDQERWLRFQMFQLRDEIERFEADLRVHLASPFGRFELWYAERQRRLGLGS
jgi:hypothetical protein